MGSGHDKPSAFQFQYRLKWYCLSKHSHDMFIEKCNTEEDNDESLVYEVQRVPNETKNTSNKLDDNVIKDILGPMYDDEMVDFIANDEDESGTNNC